MLLKGGNRFQKQNDLTTKHNEKENRFMEQLSMILKAQITLYNQLVELNKLQSKELVAGKAIRVQEITKETEEIMKKLILLDSKRHVVIGEIMQQYKINDSVNLVNLIELTNSEWKDFLLNLIYELEKIADELKMHIEQNKILLTKAMRFIDFNINVITSTTASDTYAPQGQEGSANSKKKMFDQSI